jgi:TPR repeat protein
MKTMLLVAILAATAASSFGQIYGARRYTQRIAPQLRPAPAPVNPNQQAAPQPQPGQPQNPQQPPPQAAAAYPQYANQYANGSSSRPIDPAKAAAEKAKNEEKQFEYFKKRAEEGSDHAQYELGMRYIAGKGVAPDEKLGREWLAKAAKNGNSQAGKKLTELGGEPEKTETTPLTDRHAKAAEPKPAEQK